MVLEQIVEAFLSVPDSNAMDQSHSWKASSYSASQEILHLLEKLKVHYCVHKGLPLVPILRLLDQILQFPIV